MHDPCKRRSLYKGTVARDPSFMKRIPRRANRRAAPITTAYRHKASLSLSFSPSRNGQQRGWRGSLLPPRFPNSREIEPKVDLGCTHQRAANIAKEPYLSENNFPLYFLFELAARPEGRRRLHTLDRSRSAKTASRWINRKGKDRLYSWSPNRRNGELGNRSVFGRGGSQIPVILNFRNERAIAPFSSIIRRKQSAFDFQ